MYSGTKKLVQVRTHSACVSLLFLHSFHVIVLSEQCHKDQYPLPAAAQVLIGRRSHAK